MKSITEMLHTKAMHVYTPEKLKKIFIREYKKHGDKFLNDFLDAAPQIELNEILWHVAKKYDIPEF